MLDASSTMALAGKDIRLSLKKHYGSPEEAEKAIRETAKDVEALESWATIITANERKIAAASGETISVEEGGTAFSFDALPTHLRETAKLSMAAAMLAWEAKQVKRVA